MASIAFPSLARKAVLSDGTQYGYVFVPAKPSKPTVLLLHGFPSSSYDWRYQIAHLPKAGYGVLAPDLLGYGDTDKPSDVQSYQLLNVANHILELLDHEKLDKVVGVGHDLGSAILSILSVFHKLRFSALAFIAIGFKDPSFHLAPDGQGPSTLGYISLFNTEYAAALIEGESESFDSLVYTSDTVKFRHYFSARGACEQFLKERKTLPLARYISLEERDMHNKILTSGGYTGPLNWYKALMRLPPAEEGQEFTDEQKDIIVPTLMIVTQKDYIVAPELQAEGTALRSKGKSEVARIDTGHWAMLERKEEFQAILDNWLRVL